MLKKVITYTDYNGVERTEAFYFNLSKAELAEMELSTAGGYTDMLKAIIDAKDTPSLVKIFKDLLLRSYGIKSDDGRRFQKSEQISTEFAQTGAYSQLFMELASNDKAAADFVKAVLPSDLAEGVAKSDIPAVQ